MITIKYLINDVEYQYDTALVDDAEITDEIMQLNNITEDNFRYATWWRV